jgi:hypothetical protein
MRPSTAGGRDGRVLAALALACLPIAAQDMPPDPVTGDDFEIRRSCRIVPPTGAIHDRNGDGVIHVKASGITIEFAGEAALIGLFSGPPDGMTGVGIRIDGCKDVTLVRPRISGFKVGIHATRADGLTIDGASIADTYRQRLRSTPAAEDGGDWLWPHDNDRNQWLENYGAAICVEDSANVVVRDSTVRRSQNGLLLDRVENGRIFDNDFSFLSGWGLGMWRTSRCVVNRNAFDFCVRGYSHGVYNRGQDSAGILMFEQCSGNVISENSVTHGGDGIFGFAGKEALGESPAPSAGFDYGRRGCNDNRFLANDLSYAPAHGLEMTFSFGNLVARNRFAGNAICGIWGGYSQDTTICLNEFSENGGMGYGLERGGVNVEHGYRVVVRDNTFRRDRCGVHLWWSENEGFRRKPWGAANYRGCKENRIEGNTFDGLPLAIHLRAASDTVVAANRFLDVDRDVDADATSSVARDDRSGAPTPPVDELTWVRLGRKTPVGARAHLRGRENIVMTEWGPWDHESPLVRRVEARAGAHVWAVHGFKKPAVSGTSPDVTATFEREAPPPRLVVAARKPGVASYALAVTDEGAPAVRQTIEGTIVSTKWRVRFFPTTAPPHEDAAAWKKASAATPAMSVELDALDLPFGGGSPATVLERFGFSDRRGVLGSNHFGVVAETTIPLRRGRYRVTTLSDDGVRVFADEKPLIDNWTWHVPTKDSAVLDLAADATVHLCVEYFELDGHAVLKLDVEPEPRD